MKELYINGRFLTQDITGVQRYAVELVKAIDRLINEGSFDIKGFSFVILSPRNIKYRPKLKHILIKRVGITNGYVWENTELPWYSRNGFLINLCNVGPIFKHKQVVTIHDVSVIDYPEWFEKKFALWYRIALPKLVKNSIRILTDSSFSKERLISVFGVSENNIDIIPCGVNNFFRPVVENDGSLIRQKLGISKSYALFLGSIEPRKNLNGLIKAWKHIHTDYPMLELVIVGLTGRVFSDQSIGSNSLPERVRFLGYVPDCYLPALYSGATLFLYPSLYEGFGLPPLEAMACGCPVLVSNCGSLPEICGDAALYCNPFSPDDIASKIAKILNQPSLGKELSKKGKEFAQQYSWVKTARMTMNVISQVL